MGRGHPRRPSDEKRLMQRQPTRRQEPRESDEVGRRSPRERAKSTALPLIASLLGRLMLSDERACARLATALVTERPLIDTSFFRRRRRASFGGRATRARTTYWSGEKC